MNFFVIAILSAMVVNPAFAYQCCSPSLNPCPNPRSIPRHIEIEGIGAREYCCCWAQNTVACGQYCVSAEIDI
jgi:hypothetical protein